MTVLLIDGQRVKVSDDFLSLPREEQDRTVEEIAARLRGAAKPELPPAREGGMAHLNAGIASTLGAPIDLLNMAPSILNILPGEQGFSTFSDKPFLGSESIAGMMGNVGASVAKEPPQTTYEQFMRGAGEAAGFMIPGGAAVRGMQIAGGPVAAGVGARLAQPAIEAPVAAGVAELLAGGGARVGGQMASEASGGAYGDLARPFGELAGGLVGAIAPSAAMGTMRTALNVTPGVAMATRAAKAAVMPFTEAGGRVRASDRLRSLSADPERNAAMLEDENIAGLSPAVRTGDPNLIALERSVLERNPAIRDRMYAERRQSNATLQQVARQPAEGRSMADTRAFIERRRASLADRITARIDAARQRAEDAIARLGPRRTPGENSLIVRQELDRAYVEASEMERSLWGSIPRSVTVPTTQARLVFAEIDAQTPRAQKSDIYADARRFLGDKGEFAEFETVNEMHGLYNRLRRDAREAIAGPVPNENRARISNRLAEAIWEDLTRDPSNINSKVSAQLNEAREFTRTMNEAFGQGVVGEILSVMRTGGDRIAPEMTLGATVGRGGTAGAVASKQVADALNYPEPRARAMQQFEDATQDFLREGMRRTAFPGGREFSPQAGARFAEQNRETLARFPALAAQIDAANASAATASRAETRGGALMRRMGNPRQSVGAAVEAARAGTEIERAVFGAKDPAAAAREIARQAARDPSGAASRGLKGGLVDYLMARARTGTADADGNPTISGNNMVEMLRDRKMRAVATIIMGSDEVSRLDRIASEFQKLDMARQGETLSAPIEDTPNRIISFVAGTLAARGGAQLGHGTSGASLRTSNLATRAVNRMLGTLTNDRAEALLRDAVQDADLFRALLMPINTQERARRASNVLGAWARGTASTQINREDRE